MTATTARTDRAHGTYARYRLDGCRCYPCAGAVSVYNANRQRAIAYGTWKPYVDAGPVREHVRALQSCGIGLRRIAEAAGVDRKRLQHILGGRPERGTPPQERIRPHIAQAVLAVEPTVDLIGGRTVIDAAGTRRRLQALVTIGWSQSKLAERMGWTPANLSTLLRREHTVAATARTVRELYNELWDQAPPETTAGDRAAATRARRHAAAAGWLPPQAWDDDLIDVPDDALGAELARRIALMADEELSACWNARYKQGDRSPLIAAAAREWSNRRARARTPQGVAP